MKRLSALLLCAGAAVIGGCATDVTQAPVSIAFQRTAQLKMEGAYHWSVLAQYEATKILKVSYKTLLYKISDLGIVPPE